MNIVMVKLRMVTSLLFVEEVHFTQATVQLGFYLQSSKVLIYSAVWLWVVWGFFQI